MTPIKIGNWDVTTNGIEWKGPYGRELLIDKDRLDEGGIGDRENTYDWLIHLVEKTWLTRGDIYALNSAFIYALQEFDIDLNSQSFSKTIQLQDKELAEMEK